MELPPHFPLCLEGVLWCQVLRTLNPAILKGLHFIPKIWSLVIVQVLFSTTGSNLPAEEQAVPTDSAEQSCSFHELLPPRLSEQQRWPLVQPLPHQKVAAGQGEERPLCAYCEAHSPENLYVTLSHAGTRHKPVWYPSHFIDEHTETERS